jgi:hypothetical protein
MSAGISTKVLEPGQKVHCILHGGQDGIVVKIHGEQRPANIQDFGGVMVAGGNAFFDIVFDGGTIIYRIPEAIVRGVQWRIYDEVANEEEIHAAMVSVLDKQKQDQIAQDAASKAYDHEKARLLAAYPYLEVKGNGSDGLKLAAQNLRKELKQAFPGVKFSVTTNRFSGGNSIDVAWTDGPIRSAVRKIADKYQYGNFDGMRDLYEEKDGVSSAWTNLFGGAKYVSCQRENSTSLLTLALERAWSHWIGQDTPCPTLEAYKQDRSLTGRWMGHCWFSDLVNREAAEIDLTPSVVAKPVPAAHEVSQTQPAVEAPHEQRVPPVTGAKIRFNEEKGGIEIIFAGKPAKEVLTDLKASGFRWSQNQGCWYAKRTPEIETAAYRIVANL